VVGQVTRQDGLGVSWPIETPASEGSNDYLGNKGAPGAPLTAPGGAWFVDELKFP
jgi:hypothetical protein